MKEGKVVMRLNRMSKLWVLSLVLVFVVSMIAGCGGDNKSAEKQFINIATGGTAGTYYPLGGAVAEILNKNIPGMNASAQSTGATVANINMLKEGTVELAFVQNDIVYYAANGIEMFKDKKVDTLKGIATLYPETVQIVTLESSGIKNVSELKGKRVAVGAAGSGVEANARQILEAYGITYDDINVQYLSFAEAASALKDGNVDVAFVTAGFPTAAVQDIASQNQVRLLPVDAAKADEMIKKYPFYTKTIIPADTYAGLATDTPAVAVMAMLVVNEKVSPELRYDITKAIFSNLERLQSSHSVGKMITKEGARQGMPIELNAGAEKFFKE